MASFDLSAFLVLLTILVGGAALFRWLASQLGQPGVLGELLFGILLGPSLLGWASPGVHASLFPPGNRPLLEALSWIGLVLFMYLAGSELRWSREEQIRTYFVASGGLFVPFAVGLALALAAPAWFFDGPAAFSGVILVSLVLTVSALPVMARLLADLGLMRERLAVLALGAATIDDVVGWVILGLVAGTAQVGLSGSLVQNVLLLGVVFLVALAIDRYLAPYFAQLTREAERPLFVLLLVGIFASAYLTQAAGLHAVLGPFAVGAILSRHPILRDYARVRLGELTLILFLPSFFVLAGSDVDLTILDFPGDLWAFLIILAVASVGKLAGVYIGARASLLDHATSLRAGILLNARGAVGIVVAKVGLDAGLFSQHGFSLLMMMIVVTTLGAPAFLQWHMRRTAAPTATT